MIVGKKEPFYQITKIIHFVISNFFETTIKNEFELIRIFLDISFFFQKKVLWAYSCV